MDIATIFTAILSLLAGVGIFLLACSMMSSNLESVSSNKLKSWFSKASGSKLLGVGIGAGATAAIQSSGATTVMVIGFVNAGIMSLTQAATIIYGANIGTTITGQIVALGMFGSGSISTTIIFSAFAGVGAFISSFSKNDFLKKIGGIIAGFGMLFVGLNMMSSSMTIFAELDEVRNFLAMIKNSVLLVLIGTLLTAVVQSSSVMTSVAITMVVSGLITLDQGIYITMGSNIGSCVVAIIAGITSSKSAKRTALIHFIFNVSGVVLFMLAGGLLKLFTGNDISFGLLLADAFPDAPQTQLAMFHTIFNLITVVIVLPLTNLLVSTVEKIIPESKEDEKEEKEEKPHLYYIDEHMLATPAVAVQQIKNEIINMADIAMRNLMLSLDVICTMNYHNIEQFRKNEDELNYINSQLVSFIVKVPQKSLNVHDIIYLSTAFHSINDIERIGDYAENIIEYSDILKEENSGFSDKAKAEINEVAGLIGELFTKVIEAYTLVDEKPFIEAEKIEDKIDDLTNRMSDNHIFRLGEGDCTPKVGAQYISLASNLERIADHYINVGKTIYKLI